MSMSDAEIQRLAEKVQHSLQSSSQASDSTEPLKDALGYCDEIVSARPHEPYYYAGRGAVKYYLGRASGTGERVEHYLRSAIDDFSSAIQHDPQQGNYYGGRALCRLQITAQRMAEIDPEEKHAVKQDFQTAVAKDPSQPGIWIGLLV